MDISAPLRGHDDVRMAATVRARKLGEPTRHLTVARPAGIAGREQALERARAARRKLEAAQGEGGDRFAHLRRMHD